jgi:FlaG/FlaF family flagellin (archaellin)
MVAITVILAAVIATFVLGLGEQVSQTAPQANFDFEVTGSSSSESLEITHDGGETIERETIAVNVNGSTVYDGGNAPDKNLFDIGSTDFSTEIAAGDQLVLDEGSSGVSGDLDVTILYLPTEGSSATLAETTLEFES